jgi:predicted DNA-binding protein
MIVDTCCHGGVTGLRLRADAREQRLVIRTQIQLTEEQAEALKGLAARKGVSMAELIRQAVESMVDADRSDAAWQRASAVVGRFHSGLTDISANHDVYLAEDYL